MIKDKLIVFLMKVREVKTGLGFEAFGWSAVLIANPTDEPSKWKMKYLDGPETYGLISGSAAVLKDDKYLYAYGAVEPSTHEIYVLRWEIDHAYTGNIANPEWFMNGRWSERKTRYPVPEPLFIGGTEFSVHYDAALKKYIQVQSFGFGEAKIGIRMADSLQGKWTEPYLFYTPEYAGIRKPFMYAAKAHPELHGDGLYITYNVNSFDFGELIENQNIYFPKFIWVKIVENKKQYHTYLAILIPIILHGIYDFILMANNAVLLLVFLPFIIYLWYVNFKRMRHNSEKSIFRPEKNN